MKNELYNGILYSLIKTSAEEEPERMLDTFKALGRWGSTPLGVLGGMGAGSMIGGIPMALTQNINLVPLKLLGMIGGGVLGGLAGQSLGRSDIFKKNYKI